MFKTALSVLLCLFAVSETGAQVNDPDRVVDEIITRKVPNGRHYLSFCSRGGGLVGHAFVLLSSDDPRTRTCKIDAAVGFWPKAEKDKQRLLALFTPLPGKLVDEIKKEGLPRNADCRLTILLTPDEYKILQIKFGAYKERDYVLLGNDCVTFCEQIARDVLQLEVPDRETLFAKFKAEVREAINKRAGDRDPNEIIVEEFPVGYIRMLAEMNGKRRGVSTN